MDLDQARDQIARMLGKLSLERRVAVVLRHVEGYSIPEIAEITEAPINTVRDRLQKGRKQLRGWILADPLTLELLGRRPK